MKKPSNKAKAIYLAWGLLHLALLFYPKMDGRVLNWGGRIFYPFTKGYDYWDPEKMQIEMYLSNWDHNAYDLTEFTFYMIAPILIYYIITLLKTKDEADK